MTGMRLRRWRVRGSVPPIGRSRIVLSGRFAYDPRQESQPARDCPQLRGEEK